MIQFLTYVLIENFGPYFIFHLSILSESKSLKSHNINRIGLANKRGFMVPKLFLLYRQSIADTFSSSSLSSSEELSSDDSSLALALPLTPFTTLTALKLKGVFH